MRMALMEVSSERVMLPRTPGIILLTHDLRMLITLLIRVAIRLYR